MLQKLLQWIARKRASGDRSGPQHFAVVWFKKQVFKMAFISNSKQLKTVKT